MANTVAVLTGDLIRSTASEQSRVDAAMSTLSDAADIIKTWPYVREPRFTRFRGDGWHIVISEPMSAYRAAIFMHSRLRAADLGMLSRISIGIGRVASFGTDNLSDAYGSAFRFSGQGLDTMKRGQLLTVNGDGITPLRRAIILLAAERASRWSKEQAEAVSLDLSGDTASLAGAASRLGISPQAVSARLSSAGFQAMRETIEIWESLNADSWQQSFDI
jgi:hypothetical protein